MICSKCGKPEAVIIMAENDELCYLCVKCYSSHKKAGDNNSK